MLESGQYVSAMWSRRGAGDIQEGNVKCRLKRQRSELGVGDDSPKPPPPRQPTIPRSRTGEADYLDVRKGLLGAETQLGRGDCFDSLRDGRDFG